MYAVLRLISEREQDLKRINTSLQQDLTTLREKLHEMPKQIKEDDKENTDKILEEEIVTLTSKLSSANAKLKEMFPAKTEIEAVMDKSTGKKLVKPAQWECNTFSTARNNAESFNVRENDIRSLARFIVMMSIT